MIIREIIITGGKRTQGKDADCRFSSSWGEAPTTATQLSALMLLEAAATLEAKGLLFVAG